MSSASFMWSSGIGENFFIPKRKMHLNTCCELGHMGQNILLTSRPDCEHLLIYSFTI